MLCRGMPAHAPVVLIDIFQWTEGIVVDNKLLQHQELQQHFDDRPGASLFTTIGNVV